MNAIEMQLLELIETIPVLDDAAKLESTARIGDLLDYLSRNQAEITYDVCKLVCEHLVRVLQNETNAHVNENVLQALVDLSSLPSSKGINWDQLVNLLENFDINFSEYALQILAFSHDVRYKSTIERYTNVSDDNLRQVAKDSLVELQGRS